jgi:hypothetical protein
MDVDEDCDIRGFVEGQGIPFVKGRGFYQLSKSETIQVRVQLLFFVMRAI